MTKPASAAVQQSVSAAEFAKMGGLAHIDKLLKTSANVTVRENALLVIANLSCEDDAFCEQLVASGMARSVISSLNDSRRTPMEVSAAVRTIANCTCVDMPNVCAKLFPDDASLNNILRTI